MCYYRDAGIAPRPDTFLREVKMNKRIYGIIALLLGIILLALPLGALADFGDLAGDSDFGFDLGGDGGCDSGDSDSWDIGGDSGGGGIYFCGPVYDGGSSGGGCGSSGCGGFGSLLIVILIVVGIIVLISIINKKKQQQTPVQTAVIRTPDSELSSMNEYVEKVDPGFSVSQMQTKLANLYVQLQNQWTAKDLTPLRPYLTDELYNQSDRQLDSYRKARQTPHVDRIAVQGTNVRGWFRRDGMDHIIVELSTRITVYTTDDTTGQVVKGDRNAEKFMTYEWDLCRTEGVKTGEAAEMQTVNCPNCGAPVTINKSAKCPYCDTVITLDEHDWVLFSIKALSQKTQV